jgi:hypothetical protein
MMKATFSLLLLLIFCSTLSIAAEQPIHSIWSPADPILDTDLSSSFWQGSEAIYMDSDTHGNSDPRYRTELRTRWTKDNLYFLFICPYEQLNLKPHPIASAETYELWNWDVAEVFIGSDFRHITHYKEFEISPQGEWIDLDIDLDQPKHENGWKWNSGFAVKARIDEAAHVWYGAMKIPYAALDAHSAAVGNLLRINFFRSQGPPAALHQIAWRAPMSNTFHVPEKFGLLKLVKNKQ